MPLTKLQFRPGVNRETTSYSNEGGWYDCDKVRFRFGFPEKIGGWIKTSTNYFLGSCRALHPWVALDGSKYVGLGTHLKYYIYEGGGYADITPLTNTTAAGDVTFAAVANTLSADVAVGDNTITLTSATNFPVTGYIKINSEIIFYADVSGNNLIGCVRAQQSTTEAAHSASDVVNCATLKVSDIAHGAITNDFVTFSGATTLGDNITADVLNQEYQISYVVDEDNYYVDARESDLLSAITTTTGYSPTYVFGTSSDSGNGGASVVGAYQLNTGLDTTVVGTGFGAGTFSRGTWGSGTSLAAAGTSKLRLWNHDNFGEDLLMNIRDEGIYYWDKSTGTNTRAVALSSLSGSNKAPTIAKKVIVSNTDRHVIAFGCDGENSIGTQDPLLIRFSDQESLTEWETSQSTTAGELRIGSGSEIVTAIETKQEILIFTDISLHTMQYLGPPFTFGINTLSEYITIASPLAATAVEDRVFWMGANEFYVYSGDINRIPCTVRDYVFTDINELQTEKIFCASNTAFSEIWWFYPSSTSSDCDRYVVYNYEQQIWYYGTLNRTYWIDRGVEDYPLVASTDHTLYQHEYGFDDGSTIPYTGITSYIESSQLDLGDGNNFVFIKKMIPDISFRNSTAGTPTANLTLKVRNTPGENYSNSSSNNVEKTSSTPIEQFTDQINLRLRGRSFALKVESTGTEVAWRLGSPRIDLRQDGRR